MFPHSTSLYDGDCDRLLEFVCDCDCDSLFEFVCGCGSDFDYSRLGFKFGDSFTLKGISNCYGP